MTAGQQKRFLWIGGVFDESTINRFPSMSPASNFWQRGFIEALLSQGHDVQVIGHAVERVWPFGRLNVRSSQAAFPPDFTGSAVGYTNLPFLRGPIQYMNYCREARRGFNGHGAIPDYLITFSCLNKATDWTSSISAAKKIRDRLCIPWICIVADGAAPPGADGYVYLTWAYCESPASPSPKIHIDGGVPVIHSGRDEAAEAMLPNKPHALMYMGALTPHGGASILARAFHRLPENDIELWICGRGENAELQQLAQIDGRIKLIGFVSESRLNELARSASAFANPRPSDFAPNKLNYPSKILHYLAYERPVISTWTEGLSPEYADVLIPVREETEEGLSLAIRRVLSMSKEENKTICSKIIKFNETHTWAYQVGRFVYWVKNVARY